MAVPVGFSLFETPVGTCGIVWNAAGIRGVQLPEGSSAGTRARVRERFPDAQEDRPPGEIVRAQDLILALLKGDKGAGEGLRTLRLDQSGVPPFHQLVYEAARAIPPGETRSYGSVAAMVGSPGAARAVGQALRRNPFALVVPCHRVLAAGGKVGGFTATGGVDTKLRLLALERGERVRPKARVRRSK